MYFNIFKQSFSKMSLLMKEGQLTGSVSGASRSGSRIC